jgi:hypothetical protein
MKKLRFSILAASFLLLLGSCKKDFFDINQDPNRPTETSITPDLATAAQLNNSAARNASSYDFLQRWMGYWSASGSFSRATVEMSYNLVNTFGEGIWNGIYYNVSQYRAIGRKADALNWKFYSGIAKIMEAHEMAVLVDLYGDVPYSTAFDLAGNIRPKYDKGEDIYKALLPLIDAGLASIKAADQDKNIATQDIMFKGNKTNWAKFANTLKLRLLLHAYKTNVFNTIAELAKITAEGSGFLGNNVGAMVQPGYSPDKPNPYFVSHLFLINGNEADTYNRANVFTLNLMRNMNDPRYTKVYRPAKTNGDYRGTTYGADPLATNSSDLTSGPGFGPAPTASSPMWLMTSVEAMFLVAEATARGWLTGDAKTAYQNAVRESFKFFGLTTAEADTYLAGTNVRVAWPAGGSQQDQIAVIAWQKYFALASIQANETYTDWRRLGVVQPPLSVAPERQNNPIPRRLLYPSAEYSYNAESVGGQGTVTSTSPKIFWDK